MYIIRITDLYISYFNFLFDHYLKCSHFEGHNSSVLDTSDQIKW